MLSYNLIGLNSIELMQNHKTVQVSQSEVTIVYRKEQHAFKIDEIISLEILERRIYFYDILRFILVLLLIPLVVFHEDIDHYIPIYAIILFWFLFTNYNKKRYVLQISLQDAVIAFKVGSTDRTYFLTEISKIQDLIYAESTQSKQRVTL